MERSRKIQLREEQLDLYARFSHLQTQMKHHFKEHLIDKCMPILKEMRQIYAKVDF